MEMLRPSQSPVPLRPLSFGALQALIDQISFIYLRRKLRPRRRRHDWMTGMHVPLRPLSSRMLGLSLALKTRWLWRVRTWDTLMSPR